MTAREMEDGHARAAFLLAYLLPGMELPDAGLRKSMASIFP